MADFTTMGVAIHKWPTASKPAEVTMHLRFNTGAFTSPFTRTTQTIEWPGALFDLSATFPPANSDTAKAMRSFFASLRGMAGRFYFGAYPCRYSPASMYASERVTVIALTADYTTVTADSTQNTADATTIEMESQFTVTRATATTITGTLWINSNRYPLQVGSYLSFDDARGWRHLHIVTAMTSPSGATTLTVEPPMRALPTASTPIHVHQPSGIFMLTDDAQGAMNQSMGRFNYSIAAVQSHPLEVTV
jgi:hypothetical protein